MVKIAFSDFRSHDRPHRRGLPDEAGVAQVGGDCAQPGNDVIKLFLEEISISPKLKSMKF